MARLSDALKDVADLAHSRAKEAHSVAVQFREAASIDLANKWLMHADGMNVVARAAKLIAEALDDARSGEPLI